MPGADNDARRVGDKRSGTPSRTSRPSRSGSREHTGGELIADRYRLQDRLGVGGMGEVWSGRDLRLHRDVAVKLFHGGNGMSASDLPGWLRREGIAAAQIVHPNVAVIYDQGAHRDRIYLVLELVPGTTLAELMQAGRLPVPDALSYAAQVAEALSAAHTARVVHRDIKPQNVLVTPDGTVKVVDFGIAGFLADTRSWTIARFDDAVKGAGTPEYSAPEQILGHNADARSDLYSLGTLLYTMLAGQLPYRADDFLAVMHKKTTEDAPLVPAGAGAPRDVIALVAELLSREPEERPGSAREVAARLRALLERSRPGTEEVVAAGERPVGERPVAVETGPALDEPWTAPPLEVEPPVERPAEPTAESSEKETPKPVAKLKAQVAPMAQVPDDDESSKPTDRRTEKPGSPAAKPFPWGGAQRLGAVGGEDDRAQGEQALVSAQLESRSEVSAGTNLPPASVGEPKSASAERHPQTESPSNPSAGTDLPPASVSEPKPASAERRPQAESPSNPNAGTNQPPASAGELKPASAERQPQTESPSNPSAGTNQPPASAGEPKPANAERRPQAEIPSQPSAKSDR
ncbi:MAG: protein kinase, partial [Catenulispora sp.]|nr:protein kinase [Catenulispora sp.]